MLRVIARPLLTFFGCFVYLTSLSSGEAPVCTLSCCSDVTKVYVFLNVVLLLLIIQVNFKLSRNFKIHNFKNCWNIHIKHHRQCNCQTFPCQLQCSCDCMGLVIFAFSSLWNGRSTLNLMTTQISKAYS